MTATDRRLKQMIGKMLIIGFDQPFIAPDDPIWQLIADYHLGGVILFDRFVHDNTKIKNIQNPTQLKELTTQLQNITPRKMLIAIDQEGGKVARLKPRDGFIPTRSAQQLAQKGTKEAQESYSAIAAQLGELGINVNFAPLVDLAINPSSAIIYQLERAYSDDPETVAAFAEIFMDALAKQTILSVLKHFPGHGSAAGDSHEGFVDTSDTWSEIELEPYKRLLPKTRMIMSAHVFNRHLDPDHPATLSYNTNTNLLRKQLGYQGVLLSDDMQMQAIGDHYPKREALKLAINSGVDMIMYCNQLALNNTQETIQMIYDMVQQGDISLKRIEEANSRIDRLLEGL
jgi:beta-N-acetylhexosaminidase